MASCRSNFHEALLSDVIAHFRGYIISREGAAALECAKTERGERGSGDFFCASNPKCERAPEKAEKQSSRK